MKTTDHVTKDQVSGADKTAMAHALRSHPALGPVLSSTTKALRSRAALNMDEEAYLLACAERPGSGVSANVSVSAL